MQMITMKLQALAAGAAHVQISGAAGGPAATVAAAGGASDFRFWALWPDSTVLQAVCNVLCGAAAAVLPGALRGDAALQARFSELWPHLMALLGHSNPEVRHLMAAGPHVTQRIRPLQ